MRQLDLTVGDGRVLRAYDMGADGAPTGASRSSGTTARRISGCRRSHSSPPPIGSASGGCRTTDPDTVDRARTTAGVWRRRPQMSRVWLTRWASVSLRSWGIPGALRMPLRVPHCCGSGWWAWSASPDWRRSVPRDSTGSPAWRLPASGGGGTRGEGAIRGIGSRGRSRVHPRRSRSTLWQVVVVRQGRQASAGGWPGRYERR